MRSGRNQSGNTSADRENTIYGVDLVTEGLYRGVEPLNAGQEHVVELRESALAGGESANSQRRADKRYAQHIHKRLLYTVRHRLNNCGHTTVSAVFVRISRCKCAWLSGR